MQTFVTISFSHYCEKARWGLDLVGEPYEERGQLPLFHFIPVALATRGARDRAADSVSSPYSTPVLITEAGHRICDSTRILQYLCETKGLSLYDAPEALLLDKKFSEELGPHTRRFGYHHILDNAPLLRRYFWEVGKKSQALGAIALRPLYTRVMRKALAINSKTAERSKQKVLAIANQVEDRLADGRLYLCGDSFSAADLSYAALMAPSLLLTKQEGYGCAFPSMMQTGGELADFAQHMRDRKAGAFAMQLYRDHRASSAATNSP